METQPKVSVGITSILGWLSALGALAPAIVKAVETGATDFNGPEKYLAIFGIASGLVTQIARYFQAHKLISVSSINNSISSAQIAPSGFEVGTPNVILRPESAIKPDGPGNISPAPISATEVNVAGA